MIFAPLHIVTGYSFLQSGLTIERLIRAIKKNDYFGAGISDKEVLYCLPSFVHSMDDIEKPYLLGEQFDIDGDNLSLYVINEDGYRNLIAIDLANQKGELNKEFLKAHNEGLVGILETSRGLFKEKFVEDYDSSFNKYLLDISSIYGDNFYLGVEVTSKEEIKYANRIRHFANEYTYKCIAYPRIRYEKKDDAIIIKMVNAIANDETISEKKEDGQEYFMPEEQYQKIYTKQELENTINLVKSSKFDFHKKRGELLHYPVNDAKQTLKDKCEKALKDKGLTDPKYTERLNHELDVIFEMGYADYFLIVEDYVRYAKTHDILVGPGRGSAAGSLVSYLLNIVEINPLDYDLQFERFLNPYRKTMPDIDIDFMDIKRDQMVQYMRDKYGVNRVGNIITFQTIGAKQSLRDVGRIYSYPTHHIDLLSKRLASKEKDLTLRKAYKLLPDFKSLVDSDKYFLEIVSLASKIEGLPRQSGLHAAGIVLDEKPLEESIPTRLLFDDNYTSEYEMGYLEEQGLLKMDFLSLSNLTIIYNCVNLIKSNHPDFKYHANNIPFDEPEIFKLIASGKTLGLFQIETVAMKRSIKILKPSSFNDVVALLALGRPGPMAYIPTYARRKEGKEKFSYVSDDLKDILSSTYGIIVYQEQINSIATKMARFSLGEADKFRRAISKKEREKILSAQKQFIDGAIKNGYDQKTAQNVFSDILKFAEYGFNKSHSVVYSIIACRMAWLKVHYPLEFYSSLLGNASATSDSKFSDYIFEMNSLGIKMLPPSINNSTDNFIIKDNGLLFPLTGIKNISITFMQNINEERKERGTFTNFFNFVLRMFKYKITSNQIQYLIAAGALDELYPSRASMRMSILSAMQYAELNHQSDGQLSIGIEAFPEPLMVEKKDDPLEELQREYDATGVMLSNNPLSYKKELLEKKHTMPINEALEEDASLIAGIVIYKKLIRTRKGTQMAFVKIFDTSGEIEFTVFPELYKEKGSLLERNSIIVARVTRKLIKDEVAYTAEEIEKLEEE